MKTDSPPRTRIYFESHFRMTGELLGLAPLTSPVAAFTGGERSKTLPMDFIMLNLSIHKMTHMNNTFIMWQHSQLCNPAVINPHIYHILSYNFMLYTIMSKCATTSSCQMTFALAHTLWVLLCMLWTLALAHSKGQALCGTIICHCVMKG